MLLASFGAVDEKSIKFVAQHISKDTISKFKDFLGYVPEEKREKYIEKLCDGVTKGIGLAESSNKISGREYLKYYACLFNAVDLNKRETSTQKDFYNVSDKEIKAKMYNLQKISSNKDIEAVHDGRLFEDTKYTILHRYLISLLNSFLKRVPKIY